MGIATTDTAAHKSTTRLSPDSAATANLKGSPMESEDPLGSWFKMQ